MTKLEYITKQLNKSKGKVYEQYIVNRIINLLNDFTIKFTTQQYVRFQDGRYALTDLYFPQLKIHVEINEAHHDIIADLSREEKILSALNDDKLKIPDEKDYVSLMENHKVISIYVYRDRKVKTIEEINIEIDDAVKCIKDRKVLLGTNFTNWDTNDPEPTFYINRGHIDVIDDISFRYTHEACNCFGHNYKLGSVWSGGALHPYQHNTILWFPHLYANKSWNNQISHDDSIITEKSNDLDKMNLELTSHLAEDSREAELRIVFAHVKDVLGDTRYRFKGLYKLNRVMSSNERGLIWDRIATQVRTYPQNQNHAL